MAHVRSVPRPVVALAALALAAAVAAVGLKHWAFPLLSINNDEGINAYFADVLSRGRLFGTTGGDPDAFRPWLAATSTSGEQYILKYTPVVPVLVAASLVLTGGPGLYLGVLAAANVLVTYLLAAEVLRSRQEAVIATVLLTLSPLVLVHSALLLSYLPTLVLLQVFAWALIRGRTDRAGSGGSGRLGPWLLGVAGLALGLAFFVRSFDAVVFSAPLLAWAVLRRPGPSLGAVGWFSAGAAVPVAAFAAFNAAATGSPLRLTFAVLEPQDKLGFGPRRLYPTDDLHHFGLREGIEGALRHGMLLNWWVAGGSILLVLAVVTAVRRRMEGAAWALAAAGALIPLTYVFFWGPWNATVLWGGTRYVGPFYFMPVLIPLALFGARGLADLHRWRPRAGVATAALMAVVTVAVTAEPLSANLRFTDQSRALRRLVTRPDGRQLVFVSPSTPFLMHPTPVVSNRSDLDGPVLYAIEQGGRDLDLLRRFPDRTPYRLRFRGEFTRPAQEVSGRLEQLRVVSGERIEVQVLTAPPAGAAAATLELRAAGRTTSYPLTPGATTEHLVVLNEGGPSLDGQPSQVAAAWPEASALEITLLVQHDPRAAASVAAIERLPLRQTGSTFELLGPAGPSWTTGRPQPAMLQLTA